MKTFAERLRSARVMGGLSLQDLAEKLQNRVTRQALHKYEKGEFMPDSEMLGRLCDALGVRPDYFYRKTEVGEESRKITDQCPAPGTGRDQKTIRHFDAGYWYRMKDLGIITPSYFKQFMFFINQIGFRIEEPFAYDGQEKSSRFSQLLFRALGEELISMSKAASLNNQKLAEFREKNLMIA